MSVPWNSLKRVTKRKQMCPPLRSYLHLFQSSLLFIAHKYRVALSKFTFRPVNQPFIPLTLVSAPSQPRHLYAIEHRFHPEHLAGYSLEVRQQAASPVKSTVSYHHSHRRISTPPAKSSQSPPAKSGYP